jgi:hypothetical protein
MFIEETVLLAVMEEDEDKARELLSTFLPNELSEFEDAVRTLLDLIREIKQ